MAALYFPTQYVVESKGVTETPDDAVVKPRHHGGKLRVADGSTEMLVDWWAQPLRLNLGHRPFSTPHPQCHT
jgi:hypothetical protein